MAPEFCGWRHVHVTHHMQGVQEGRKRFFCLSAHMGKLPPSSREGEKKSTQKKLKKDKHFFVSQRLTLSLLRPSFSFPLSLSLWHACFCFFCSEVPGVRRGQLTTIITTNFFCCCCRCFASFHIFSKESLRYTTQHSTTQIRLKIIYIYVCKPAKKREKKRWISTVSSSREYIYIYICTLVVVAIFVFLISLQRYWLDACDAKVLFFFPCSVCKAASEPPPLHIIQKRKN